MVINLLDFVLISQFYWQSINLYRKLTKMDKNGSKWTKMDENHSKLIWINFNLSFEKLNGHMISGQTLPKQDRKYFSMQYRMIWNSQNRNYRTLNVGFSRGQKLKFAAWRAWRSISGQTRLMILFSAWLRYLSSIKHYIVEL